MNDLLIDFKEESAELTVQLIDILEGIEGDFTQVERLDEYGQIVDRIMGGAKSVALAIENPTPVDEIAQYAELCKAVGYKGSQITDNESFYDIVVALLLDATEMLQTFLKNLGTENAKSIKDSLKTTFLDRLRWVSEQFGENVRSSVAIDKNKASQAQIDDLLKNMGL